MARASKQTSWRNLVEAIEETWDAMEIKGGKGLISLVEI